MVSSGDDITLDAERPDDGQDAEHESAARDDADRDVVGQKIRAFRKARRLTVRDLATRAEVSPGFISQLENGRTNAGVGTLRRIASALGIAFVDLFSTDTSTSRVLRRSERPLLPTRSGTRKYAVTLPPLQGVEIYISEIEPGQMIGDATFTHGDSQEIIYVLNGTVVLTVSGTKFEVSTGDSIEFRSSEPHSLENFSNSMGEVMWISSPPTVPQFNLHGNERSSS
ncbi:helix-turn-helix domain-containing protein [Humidisolicoccus flavus]|uniref:helix-turn-helix domain-containing protein n=1 Tax=Humidisolicoccus flavus TaxID=3111414 RepID=UPI003250F0D3